jgi:repressor LexA
VTTCSINHPDMLTYIAMYCAEHGYPPTYREIAKQQGVSLSTVATHMEVMRAQGLITYEPGKSRTMAVTGKGQNIVENQ